MASSWSAAATGFSGERGESQANGITHHQRAQQKKPPTVRSGHRFNISGDEFFNNQGTGIRFVASRHG